MNGTTLEMNTINQQSLRDTMQAACAGCAPSWPLDRSIAVNPWWQMRSEKFTGVSAKLSVLGSVNCLMPAEFYRAHWGTNILSEHLEHARRELQVEATEEQLLAALDATDTARPWLNIVDYLDAMPEQRRRMAWHAEVQQQISQFCGAYFQYPERMSSAALKTQSFFHSWREVLSLDKGIGILMGAREINQQIRLLPQSVAEVYQAFHDEVLSGRAGAQGCAGYATSLLLDVNGWASWLAYQVWQDQLAGRENDLVEQLLAIRLSWELLLWRHLQTKKGASYKLIQHQFLAQFDDVSSRYEKATQNQQLIWVWQRALECAYQLPLAGKLLSAQPAQTTSVTLQAVFCIDVRSEPMRRALEAQNPDIQTLGFAGFFGLPIEYRNAFVRDARPQLPGLLSPALSVSRAAPAPSSMRHNDQLQREVAAKGASGVAPASFGLVEAGGLYKAFDLLRCSFAKTMGFSTGNTTEETSPWKLRKNGEQISLEEQTQLLQSILTALGLTAGFASHVLLVGHGSQSANNPHAAGLDCGACGGQSGEVNVRVLAQMLNDTQLRKSLLRHGIDIPDETRFVAALHNTCTDEIVCFDSPDHSPYAQWLKDAQALAQERRAPGLGIAGGNAANIAQQLLTRSRDWAQLRPEWGLANNASFIVAPRALTRNIDLEGRSFLHDYTWQHDLEYKVLEQIITAPMIVTNWINLQYYASVVDPVKYGSGNKMLHNVVGDHIGVFEGNGGDLRIGLPIQSVHDGINWRHQPLRLSVYIAAPTDALADIINAHTAVRELLDNGWLFLFAWDVSRNLIQRYDLGQWVAVESGEGHV